MLVPVCLGVSGTALAEIVMLSKKGFKDLFNDIPRLHFRVSPLMITKFFRFKLADEGFLKNINPNIVGDFPQCFAV